MTFDFPGVLVKIKNICVASKLIAAGCNSNVPSHKENYDIRYREHAIYQTADAEYKEFMSIGCVQRRNSNHMICGLIPYRHVRYWFHLCSSTHIDLQLDTS
jgi:hypothetical protein